MLFRIQERARKLGRMIQNKPVSALNQAIGWVEFLAEFKTLDNLLPESRNLSLIQYYLLDILGIVILSLIAIVWIFYKINCFFCRKYCGRKNKLKAKSE